MRNKSFLILGLLLAACKSGPEKAPEFEVKTVFVDRLVAVPTPCERTIARINDPMVVVAQTPEEHTDRLILSDSAWRAYSLLLEAALISCGGKVTTKP